MQRSLAMDLLKAKYEPREARDRAGSPGVVVLPAPVNAVILSGQPVRKRSNAHLLVNGSGNAHLPSFWEHTRILQVEETSTAWATVLRGVADNVSTSANGSRTTGSRAVRGGPLLLPKPLQRHELALDARKLPLPR